MNADNASNKLFDNWRFSLKVTAHLVRHEIRSRYTQTRFAATWGLIQAGLNAGLFILFFGYLLNWKINNLPFPVYVLSGTAAWSWISGIVSEGSQSLWESKHSLQSFAFPRFIIPLSKAVTRGIDSLYHFFWLGLVMLYYKTPISVHIIGLPLAFLYTLIAGLAPVVWILLATKRLRDLLQLLPLLLTAGLWTSPVFFDPSAFPKLIQTFMNLSPWAACVDLWRWTILGTGSFQYSWIIHFLALTLLLAWGLIRFEKIQNSFAEN